MLPEAEPFVESTAGFVGLLISCAGHCAFTLTKRAGSFEVGGAVGVENWYVRQPGLQRYFPDLQAFIHVQKAKR